MPRRKVLQTNFAAGELAPELGLRQDTEQYQNGAKSLRNRRCLIGGGTVRRPGSWLLANLGARVRLVPFIVNTSTQYLLAFQAGRMDAYLPDGTPAGSITGCPWTGEIWQGMGWAQAGNTLFLAHQGMVPQVVVRTGAASWSFDDFAFAVGPHARFEQPYLRLANAEITLLPSARTGTITLTTSDPYFTPEHVGSFIRYVRKAVLITTYVSPTEVTGDVTEPLPRTTRVEIADSTDYTEGEEVFGPDSGTEGFVVAIPDSTHVDVVITRHSGGFDTGENLVGPNAKKEILGDAATDPAAVKTWDEQIFGTVYGYPSCVEIHRSRLIFAGHPVAASYIFASQIALYYNFDVGEGGDSEAIIESIGDAGAQRIVQLHSAEQLLLLTDRGGYFVPESAAVPFRASSMAFYPFGSSWPFSDMVKPVAFDDGVIGTAGSLVVKLTPTGDSTHIWEADQVSLLASHLVKTPFEASVVMNYNGGPERYVVFVNEDYTLAVMQLVAGQQIRNFTPWDTDGSYYSVAALNDTLYAVVGRVLDGETRYYLEQFDQDVTLDCASEVASLGSIFAIYGARPVSVVQGLWHIGLYDNGFDIPEPYPDGPFVVGFDYETKIELMPPAVEGANGEGAKAGDYMRITEALVFVETSMRFAAQGYELQAYQIGDDLTEQPNPLEGPQRFQFLGWQRQPTISVTQTDPLPLKVLAMKTEVVFS